MFLSNHQHEQLRTIVMDFEIPYRAFVAKRIFDTYATENDFINALQEKANPENYSSDIIPISNYFSQFKSNPKKLYSLLKNVNDIFGKSIVEDSVEVPFVSQINALVLVFSDIFSDYILRFYEASSFWEQADRYHYVRNKLSHPGCKTLEKLDMEISLEFILTSMVYLSQNESECFYVESFDQINKKISALSSTKVEIPVPINNFAEMPFSESRIVCREHEIENIKKFVYGRPGALRKKSSLCIFGYGGVGKTVLVLDAVKSIVQDLVDKTTINDYSPEFILFVSAKKSKLNISITTGSIEELIIKTAFDDFASLKKLIFGYLGINTFENYEKQGLIIIDNLETIDKSERTKINEFIEYESPAQVQYIITSRNEEPYAERWCLSGFNDVDSCSNFISEYVCENNLEIDLSKEDKVNLLEITKGNTLVLVLSLKRLGLRFDSIAKLKCDLSKAPTIKTIDKELRDLPANGYEIISEYMFKNTFEEIEKLFVDSADICYSLLKILAVYPNNYVDIYTLSMLSKLSYQKIDPIINMLCKYLIVEKKNNEFCLNEFAEKYIIFRFLPDKESYLNLSTEIEASTRQIKEELKNLRQQINENPTLNSIIKDWSIITEGDRIAAAKVFKLYGDVRIDCRKGNFFVEAAYEEVKQKFKEIEISTIHPYIKYQKARILRMLYDTNMLSNEELAHEIRSSYQECIWIIKTNILYAGIKKTKSYASILWLFGTHLMEIDNEKVEAAKFLEESFEVFNLIKIRDNEYFKCVSYLGRNYLELYKDTKITAYLRKARQMSDLLYKARNTYDTTTKRYATSLRTELRNFIPTLR